jgi:hypothetical protein
MTSRLHPLVDPHDHRLQPRQHRFEAAGSEGQKAIRRAPIRVCLSIASVVRARPLLRLAKLGAMASFSALASEAVCLNACSKR